MFKKYLTLIIAILVINLSLGASVFADTKEDKQTKFAGKVKANVARLGTGKDAQISVKLKDGTRLKGYVSEIADDYFSVTNLETGTATAVNYHNAKQVRGSNSSTGVRIAIAVGLIAALIVIAVVVGGN